MQNPWSVLLIAVGLVVGAVLVGVSLAPPQQSMPSCGLYCGMPPALGAPSEAVNAASYWYNFSIQSAGGGIAANTLNFQAQTPNRTNVSTGGILTLVSGASVTLAIYTMNSATWSSGGATLLISGTTFSLEIPHTMGSLSGDWFVASLTGSFQGTDTVVIP